MTPVSLLPESAPFTDEQRAWLDGFLSGWLGVQENGSSVGMTNGDTALIAAPPPAEQEDEDFPWHDPAIAMDERLELAEERPFPRKLMAAMAQLDCGSCGYDCQRYAEAIASGEEKSLKLCSPGGSETAKKLKELVKLGGADTFSTNGKSTQNGTAEKETGWSRKNPFAAKLKVTKNLNGEGSAKHTSHVEIDLAGSDLKYDVGDSLGVYPTNCDDLVADLVAATSSSGEETVTVDDKQASLANALSCEFCLTEVTEELLETMIAKCGNRDDEESLKQILDDEDKIAGWDVLDLLQEFSSVKVSGQELVSTLSPMKPRLYSISSSMKAHPDQVHLTIGRVGWEFRKRQRKGVASTMFSDRLGTGSDVRVFVQKSHGFCVPENPDAGMIMIGPGTGIAPFRAFLQERKIAGASGKNWLFFGDQCQATDFLYHDEFQQYLDDGLLTRLDTAFSRDQQQKIYVQDRMLEHGQELWNWLQSGAHFYVCGDAKRMAVDVDRALKQIIATHGKMSEQQAAEYVSELTAAKRYCRDVY